ncbi:hypothetical protein [Nonomuraea sp. NPDC049784]|uniref:hypothetical protein n=1 Tax=Nonomuraea sp. NPDC049784 TaxID=3154361 RepID=UPI0033C4EC80
MLTAGRLADGELLGDEQGADSVTYEIAVALGREVALGVAEPAQDQQPLVIGQRLDQINVKHEGNYLCLGRRIMRR